MFSLFSAGDKRDQPHRAIVRCEDDYERALERVSELGTPPDGSTEEAELQGLLMAIEKWEARHDDDETWD